MVQQNFNFRFQCPCYKPGTHAQYKIRWSMLRLGLRASLGPAIRIFLKSFATENSLKPNHNFNNNNYYSIITNFYHFLHFFFLNFFLFSLFFFSSQPSELSTQNPQPTILGGDSRLRESKGTYNGRSNPEVAGSIPTEVKRFFLCLVWFPDSLY